MAVVVAHSSEKCSDNVVEILWVATAIESDDVESVDPAAQTGTTFSLRWSS